MDSPGDQPDPDRIADAVTALPAVARLHGGRFGEVATYLPGRRVTGVQVGEERIAIHVVGRLGVPVPRLVAGIRAAVAPLVRGLPVDVVVEDLAADGESTDEPAGQGRG